MNGLTTNAIDFATPGASIREALVPATDNIVGYLDGGVSKLTYRLMSFMLSSILGTFFETRLFGDRLMFTSVIMRTDKLHLQLVVI